MWAWILAAWAAEPSVAFGDDGLLKASMEIGAPADAVRAVLADAPRVARWSPDVLGMDAVSPVDGECRDFKLTTKGLWNPLSYVIRRCATAGGFSERLVSSETFTRVQADWTITPTAAGCRVDYLGGVEVNLPVPKAMLQKAQTSSMASTLKRLAAEATER